MATPTRSQPVPTPEQVAKRTLWLRELELEYGGATLEAYDPGGSLRPSVTSSLSTTKWRKAAKAYKMGLVAAGYHCLTPVPFSEGRQPIDPGIYEGSLKVADFTAAELASSSQAQPCVSLGAA
jgi:hypothetical protein